MFVRTLVGRDYHALHVDCADTVSILIFAVSQNSRNFISANVFMQMMLLLLYVIVEHDFVSDWQNVINQEYSCLNWRNRLVLHIAVLIVVEIQ